MPTSRYYTEQAKLLLSWALAARDPATAARLEARGRELLTQANMPEDSAVRDLKPLLDEFNAAQLRKDGPCGN
jgi:hypothetical protein